MTHNTVYATMVVVLACLLMPASCNDELVAAKRRTVNCVKQPYAPRCRGVAAKRFYPLVPVTDYDMNDAEGEMVRNNALSSVRNYGSTRNPRLPEAMQSLLNRVLLEREQQQYNSRSLQEQPQVQASYISNTKRPTALVQRQPLPILKRQSMPVRMYRNISPSRQWLLDNISHSKQPVSDERWGESCVTQTDSEKEDFEPESLIR